MGLLHMASLGYSLRIESETKYMVEIIKMLLEKGLDYKVKDCDGRNAYEIAVQQYSWMHIVFEPYMSVEDKKTLKIK